MAELPVPYMKAVREVTGFWGAYPLWQELSPGAYGRRVKGQFISDGRLSDLAGFDATAFAVTETAARSPAETWLSEGTRVEDAGVRVGGPALPVSGKLRVQFSRAEQVLFGCRNGREWSFQNLRKVKEHLLSLYQQGQWDRRDILVTHVMKVDAAWVFYSTQGGQSVEVSVSVTPGPAVAADLLEAAIGSGKLEVGHGGLAASGYASQLPGPGTPLFQAIKISRWPRPHPGIVLRGPGDFDEAMFGDPDEPDDLDEGPGLPGGE
jgi:hypothetical protein